MGYTNGKIIMELMSKISNKMDKDMRCCFCESSLTVPQMAVITLLYQNGEMKISDISINMGLTNSTTSGIIDRLERMELVRRLRDEADRRIVKVVLTEKANEMQDELRLKHEGFLANCFKKTSEEEMETIVKGLELLNKIIDNKN
ncbi:MAG: MarR family winged helix-turn-helix transcriptional regulator [Caulobacteraceae bacterium]